MQIVISCSWSAFLRHFVIGYSNSIYWKEHGLFDRLFGYNLTCITATHVRSKLNAVVIFRTFYNKAIIFGRSGLVTIIQVYSEFVGLPRCTGNGVDVFISKPEFSLHIAEPWGVLGPVTVEIYRSVLTSLKYLIDKSKRKYNHYEHFVEMNKNKTHK